MRSVLSETLLGGSRRSAGDRDDVGSETVRTRKHAESDFVVFVLLRRGAGGQRADRVG